MSSGNLVKRLANELDAFKDGFYIFSEASSMDELAKQFCLILGGNLLTIDVRLYYKRDQRKTWSVLYPKAMHREPLPEEYQVTNNFYVKYPNKDNLRIAVGIPLLSGASFVLLIGDKIDKKKYSEYDKMLVQIFASLLSISYSIFLNKKKEKELIFSLNHKVLQLNYLIESGIKISKLNKEESLLRLALERARALTSATYGTATISKNSIVTKTVHLPNEEAFKTFEPKDDFSIDHSFDFFHEVISLTLYDKKSRTGIVNFEETDRLILESLARQVHAALQNDYYLRESVEKNKIDKEIQVAASIQRTLLPKKMPTLTGYDVAGINIPTRDIGGDYYDAIKLHDGKLAFAIADVTGKGVGASLLVNSLSASLRAYLDTEFPLAELASKLNRLIYNASTSDKFITFTIVTIVPETGIIQLLNAGHNPTLYIPKDGNIQFLEAGGVALGMFNQELPYDTEIITLNKGDRLLLFTDGIIEAMNNENEEFGEKRFLDFIRKNEKLSAENFVSGLVDEVGNFIGNAPQSDDVTLVYLKKV